MVDTNPLQVVRRKLQFVRVELVRAKALHLGGGFEHLGKLSHCHRKGSSQENSLEQLQVAQGLLVET